MAASTDDLLRELIKQLKQGNSVGSGGNSSGVGSKLFENAMPANTMLGKLAGGLGFAVTAVSKFTNAIEENLEPWRQAGKVGATFGNDVVGMSISATQARLNLGELSSIIQENTAGFIGLGGTVGKGAQAFADMSKKFFEMGGAADELRHLGYTNKELNEVLALQITMQRHTMKLDEESQRKSLKAAAELAKEMDAMARLTGKSRDKQMAEMRKAALDRQVEAKFLLMKQQNPEMDIAAVRAAYDKAVARMPEHMQQTFKEQFTMGHTTSPEASMTASLFTDTAMKTQRLANDLNKGIVSGFDESMTSIRASAVDSAKNTNLLFLATLNKEMSPIAGLTQGMLESTSGLRESVARLDEAAGGLKSSAELLKDAGLLIKQEQEKFGNATQQYLQAQGRATDIAAGVAEGIKQVYNSESMSNLFKKLDTATTWKGSVTQDGTQLSFAEGTINAAKTPLVEINKITGEWNATLAATSNQFKEIDSRVAVAGTIIQAGVTGTQGLVSTVDYLSTKATELYKHVKEEWLPIVFPRTEVPKQQTLAPDTTVKRREGSIGMTGNLFENWGNETVVKLHGIEGVVRPQDMEKMAKGFKQQGMFEAVNNLAKSFSTVQFPILQQPEKPYSDFNPELGDINPAIEDTIDKNFGAFEDIIGNLEKDFEATGDEVFANFETFKGALFPQISSVVETLKESAKQSSKSLEQAMTQVGKVVETSSSTMVSVGRVIEKTSTAPKIPDNIKNNAEPQAARSSQETLYREQQRQNTKVEKQELIVPPLTIDKSALKPVIDNLEKLNIQVASLMEQQADLARKQVSAIEKHSKTIR